MNMMQMMKQAQGLQKRLKNDTCIFDACCFNSNQTSKMSTTPDIQNRVKDLIEKRNVQTIEEQIDEAVSKYPAALIG